MPAVVRTFMPSGLWNVANEETFILRPSSQNCIEKLLTAVHIFVQVKLAIILKCIQNHKASRAKSSVCVGAESDVLQPR